MSRLGVASGSFVLFWLDHSLSLEGLDAMSAPAASHFMDALDEDLENECPLVGINAAADLNLKEAVQHARVSFSERLVTTITKYVKLAPVM